jgi:hypothetical protein
MRLFLKAAINATTGDALFETAYPSIATITAYHKQLLTKCAQDLDYPAIAHRVEKDDHFVEVVGRIVSGLFCSHLRFYNLPGRS